MKKIASTIVAFLLAMVMNAQTQKSSVHIVQSGETLSSIARTYGITVSGLLKLNPDLNPDYIMAGQKINVSLAEPTRPKYKTTHEVKKKETVYGISHMYGVTESALLEANPQLKNGKLKKGETINIPYSDTDNSQWSEQLKRHEEETNKIKVQMFSKLNAVVILPFALDNAQASTESQKMVNLYQGFLLAVDSLKQRGYSVDVYAYDETAADIASILDKPMVKNAHLIVGPARQANVKAVADFAHSHSIAHVVPMSNDNNVVHEHTTTFQVNSSSASLYPQVFDRFLSLHHEENVIFVNMNDKNDNMNYITEFKRALDANGKTYHTVSMSEISTIRDMLFVGKSNIVIPTCGTASSFDTLCKKFNELRLGDYNIQFFGYPEWQTFADRYEKEFAHYRCQFYTPFYTNSRSSRTRQFNASFNNWFKQPQVNSYPRYGEMGFDIGAYFLKALKENGSAFPASAMSVSYSSMEFPFNFEKKNSWSGYRNKGFFFVTYSSTGAVSVR